MRQIADPTLDDLVAAHARRHGTSSLHALLRGLFASEQLPTDNMLVQAYLDATPVRLQEDSAVIECGQRVFALYGPETLLILGCYSLPLAYAAGNGVQVIDRARRLKDDALRRLCETAQMVIDVMHQGELGEDGVGTRAARKVRLMHALIRHLVAHDERRPWNAAWGVPINQEDLAGTLLSFSLATLDGLQKMGVRMPNEDAEAFLRTWGVVGRLLGIDESLLPRRLDHAVQLAQRIGARQMRATPEGTELASQLLRVIEDVFPIAGYGNSLMRFFLEQTMFGPGMADLLGLPRANWTRTLVQARAAQKRLVMRWLPHLPGGIARRSWFARYFTQALILRRRPDSHAPFEVPPAFRRLMRRR